MTIVWDKAQGLDAYLILTGPRDTERFDIYSAAVLASDEDALAQFDQFKEQALTADRKRHYKPERAYLQKIQYGTQGGEIIATWDRSP